MTPRTERKLVDLARASVLKQQGKNYREIAEIIDRSPAWVYYHFGPTVTKKLETRGRPAKDKRALVTQILNDRAKGVSVKDTCFRLDISKSYYQYLRQITLGVNMKIGRPRKEDCFVNRARVGSVEPVQDATGELPAGPDVGEAVRDEAAERDS